MFILQSERDSGIYVISETRRLANPAEDNVFGALW